MTREDSIRNSIAEARPEITEAMVFSHAKGEEEYFSEEEFPQVPEVLAKLVADGELTATEVLEFALKQAAALKKDVVFLVVLAALKDAGIKFYEKTFEGGKPLAILAEVTPRMMNVLLGGGPNNSTFDDYKKLCGLD